MSEVDAQALQIRRKHVGLPHLYGEAPVAVEEARRHWERQLLVIAAELLQQQRRGQGGDGAGADDGGGFFLLGSDGMMVVDILLVTCLIDTLACGWLPAPEHLEADCWNRFVPIPRRTKNVVLVVAIIYVLKRSVHII